MQKEDRNLAVVHTLRELRYTLIATGLVLIFAFVFYLFLPSLGKSLGTKEEKLPYKRIYSYFRSGVDLEYQALSPKNSENKPKRLKQDLEILARRFANGNFDILKLPGIKAKPQYQAILGYQRLYNYKVRVKNEGAVLEIRATSQNPSAVQALHKYLRYLEKNWGT